MKRPVWLLVGVVLAVLVVWFAMRPGGDGELAIDLIAEFDAAVEKRPNPETFEVRDVTIAGETRPSIFVNGPSRLVYRVVAPDNGELRVGLGILEEGWTVEGDGVLFRVLLGAGGPPEEILNIMLNPYGNPADRGWYDVALDLSEYSGETIDLFFNTNSSGPSRPPVDHRDGDLPVWGTPRLYSR